MTNSTLDITFEGYFTSRIATDPDPTNEDRGLSGYTMALAEEDRLDQIIRFHVDAEYLERNARKPMREMGIEIGVNVTGVSFHDKPWNAGAALIGAKVDLVGEDAPLGGPIFESRNNTTGSDDTMSFVVDPFDLRIDHPGRGVHIRALDYIDPNDHDLQLWQITNPKRYARRLTSNFAQADMEAAEAIGVYDTYGYFRDRRHYLERLQAQAEKELQSCSNPTRKQELQYAIQTYKSRVHQIEFWGDRVTSKLQYKVSWQHDINGKREFEGDVGGIVSTEPPWRVKYWFGGWDGDLLTGYVRGTLSVPFAPRG